MPFSPNLAGSPVLANESVVTIHAIDAVDAVIALLTLGTVVTVGAISNHCHPYSPFSEGFHWP